MRVLHGQHPVAVTDRNGKAFVPSLLPYQTNRLGIAHEDLPIEARADELEVHVIPPRRSGVLASFPVRRVDGGTATLLREDGSVVPAGAIARQEGYGVTLPVGQRGEIFLPVLGVTARLLVIWQDEQCEVHIIRPPEWRPLDNAGSFVCRRMEN